MKKLLGLLGSFGLVAAAGITVVSCGDSKTKNPDTNPDTVAAGGKFDLKDKNFKFASDAGADGTTFALVAKNGDTAEAGITLEDNKITLSDDKMTIATGTISVAETVAAGDYSVVITATPATPQSLKDDDAKANTVEFTLTVTEKATLKDLVIGTPALGEIDKNDAATIIAAVVAKNEGVQGDQLVAKNITDTTADINVIDGSTVYNPLTSPIPVSFTVKPVTPTKDLVIGTPALGEIDKNDAATIIAAVVAKNQGVQGDQLVATKITDTTADINVIDGSTVYNPLKSPIPVSFTVKPVTPGKKDLSVDIVEKNLGTIADKKIETILAAVKAKNPNFVYEKTKENDNFKISVHSSTSDVDVTPTDSNATYNSTAKVNFKFTLNA